jgi:hypothetical protein
VTASRFWGTESESNTRFLGHLCRTTANGNQQKNAERDLLLVLALLFRRIQGNQIPTLPFVDRSSSRQTLHPHEKGDGIEPGTHRQASLIFSQTSP